MMETGGRIKQWGDVFNIYPARVVRVDGACRMKMHVRLGFGVTQVAKINLRGVRLVPADEHVRDQARAFVRNELMQSMEMEGSVDEERIRPLGDKDDDVWFSSEGTFGRLGMVVLRIYPDEEFLHFTECDADVWYLKGETDPEQILKRGKLLNQVLLDKGYAQKI